MTAASTIRTTCPRDCYDACGVVVKLAADGTVNVVGDPDAQRQPGRVVRQMFDWLQRGLARSERSPDASLEAGRAERRRPLRADRVGRGARRYRQSSQRDPQQRRAASILQTHYTGTCSLIAGTFPLRFFNSIGATEVDPDTVCNKAGHVALQLMYGESTRGFDPRTIDGSQCVMIWGANPSTSAPHVHQYWLSETAVPKIVVDPIRHETAAAADMHLQLYPGTDGALAFAMLHVIRAAGRIDRTFLAAHSQRLGGDRNSIGCVHSGLG